MGVFGALGGSFLLAHRALCTLFWLLGLLHCATTVREGRKDFPVIGADMRKVFSLPGPLGRPLAMQSLGSARDVSLSYAFL